ncbi:hypothetical protein TNCT_124381 [Trichonephila clavata]|uniref:Uncharacterized protein n=1 Tax=Trichonephila clavata TaxID=2740835 RepID=A0A8X6L3X6_TRICU|nr:hypothetical protein TNCT_124381 [Trichonephila clavata]
MIERGVCTNIQTKGIFGHTSSPRKISLEIMTTKKPTDALEVNFSKYEGGGYYYNFVKDARPKKEEEDPLFSVRLGRPFLKSLFKKYLSDEEYRNQMFSEAEGVDDMSLLRINENSAYVMNKAVIQMVIKDSFDCKHLLVFEDLVMYSLEDALNELHEDINIEMDNFLMEEMEKFELAKKQKEKLL